MRSEVESGASDMDEEDAAGRVWIIQFTCAIHNEGLLNFGVLMSSIQMTAILCHGLRAFGHNSEFMITRDTKNGFFWGKQFLFQGHFFVDCS